MKDSLAKLREQFDQMFEQKKKKLTQGDECRRRAKMEKVYVAVKRRLQPGDKMAGRHGNKGVVSKIVPVEDMPYMADGTPVDIVLNPLGVPSRMNVGQILEVHLGVGGEGPRAQDRRDAEGRCECPRGSQVPRARAPTTRRVVRRTSRCSTTTRSATKLARRASFATPVFDADEEEIKKMLELAGLPGARQVQLFDGRTATRFSIARSPALTMCRSCTTWSISKTDARSTWICTASSRSSLLGGKAQFGGQRFGEISRLVLEGLRRGKVHAAGNAHRQVGRHVNGRTKVYENIVKGEHRIEAGMPELFNVLVKEIRSLAIDVDMERY